jgi:dihydrofolate reductase
MAKLIAAMNMTLDGFCDHTAGIADEEIHDHYTELLRSADAIIYGRITYQLMEYWKPFVANPTGEKSMDDFAIAIDNVPKIVYSRTLENVDWNNTELKREIVKDEILDLKQRSGKDILVGSPSMIVALGNLGVIDQYQLGIQPMVIGTGLPLFKNVSHRIDLKLLKTKTFGCGAVFHYYQPTSNTIGIGPCKMEKVTATDATNSSIIT